MAGTHPYSRTRGKRKCRSCKVVGTLQKIRTSQGKLLYLCGPCRSEYIARLNNDENQ